MLCGCTQAVGFIGRSGQSTDQQAASREMLEVLVQEQVYEPLSQDAPAPKVVASALGAISLLADPLADFQGNQVRWQDISLVPLPQHCCLG